MCYILYGATDETVSFEDYSKALEKSKYKLAIGTKHNVKMCIVNDLGDYSMTNRQCDCDFPTGKHDENATEIQELASLINELKNTKAVKHIYIALAWAGRKVKNEKSISINDISLSAFLANMEKDCLYTIDLQK